MEDKTLQEVLKALDEYLVYQTNNKLHDLIKIRKKHRERDYNAGSTGRNYDNVATTVKQQ